MTQASEKEKASARIQYDLGVDNFSKGNVTGALAAFEQAERSDAQFADLQSAMGLVYLALGKYPDAEKHLKQALLIKTGWSEAHNNLGNVYLAEKRYDEAIAEFELALGDVLYPTPSLAEGNMGYAMYKKGDKDTGVKHIKNATLVNPKFCRGYMWLGEIFQSDNEWREAEKYLDRFVERCVLDASVKNMVDAETSAEVYYRLGQVEEGSGNLPRARSAFDTCKQAGNETPFYEACERALKKIQ